MHVAQRICTYIAVVLTCSAVRHAAVRRFFHGCIRISSGNHESVSPSCCVFQGRGDRPKRAFKSTELTFLVGHPDSEPVGSRERRAPRHATGGSARVQGREISIGTPGGRRQRIGLRKGLGELLHEYRATSRKSRGSISFCLLF